jgi:signal transduction histidine kinase/ligand-binding sensor domain-containing protein
MKKHQNTCILLVIVFVSSAPLLFAQPQTPLHFKRVGVDEGLSAAWVECLAKDRAGFVWIGTENGANRFDGKHFWHYGNVPFDTTSLPSSYANAIVQDSSGALWIATNQGLSRRDPATNVWQRILQDTSTTEARAHSLPSNYCSTLLCTPDGTLWVGTRKGLCRLQGFGAKARFGTISTTTQDNITTICQDRHTPHILWLGTRTGDILRCDTRSGSNERCTPSIAYQPEPQSGSSITSLVQEVNGTVWMARDNSGLVGYVPQSKQWLQYTHNPANMSSLSYNRVNSLALEEKQQCLWVGTWGGGLQRLDLRTNSFSTWKHNSLDPTTISYDMISSLLFDHEGNLWCGTPVGISLLTAQARRKGGFRSFIHDPNSPYASETLPFPTVSCLFPSESAPFEPKRTFRNGVWLGTYGGVAWFDAVKNTIQRVALRIPRGHDTTRAQILSSIGVDTSGTAWIGTNDGLYSAHLKNGKPVFTHLTSIPHIWRGAFIRTLFCDAQGIVWISDNATGLTMYDPSKKTFLSLHSKDSSAFQGFSAIIPLSFAERVNERGEREIWFGGWRGGLQCYNTATKRFHGYHHDPANPRSLPSEDIGYVFIRHVDEKKINKNNGGMRDEIWCAPVNAGLCRLTNPADTRRSATFERFTAENAGIPKGSIWGITEHAGKLWCASQRGILKFSPEERIAQLFGRADGFPSLEFTSCARLSDGQMFFGSSQGLVTFHPDSLNASSEALKASITGCNVQFVPISLTGSQASGNTAIEMQWKQNVVSFSFAAPSFAAPDQTQYRTKLEGFDTDWREQNSLQASNEATYTNLDDGEYTFRVQARITGGTWNEAGEARVRLQVVPPFWRTWWFVGAASVLAFAGFGFVVRSLATARLRRKISVLEELNRERERISQDVHDDVGSTLTRVALLAETLKFNASEHQLQSRLEAIANVARDATNTLGEIIWAIKPVNDTLDNFLAYTREYAMEFFEETEIRCVVEKPEVVPLVSLLPEIRRNAFLVVKESLNNVVKHSGASSVRIVFFLEPAFLEIRIADDGCGFDAERRVGIGGGQRSGGNGLGNIRRRLESLGGTLCIESAAAQGTLVIARMPINVL